MHTGGTQVCAAVEVQGNILGNRAYLSREKKKLIVCPLCANSGPMLFPWCAKKLLMVCNGRSQMCAIGLPIVSNVTISQSIMSFSRYLAHLSAAVGNKFLHNIFTVVTTKIQACKFS